jgi:hypothetical protein
LFDPPFCFVPQNMGNSWCFAALRRDGRGSAEVNSISMGNLSPAWIPGEAFFEEIYAFQGANEGPENGWKMAGPGLENV